MFKTPVAIIKQKDDDIRELKQDIWKLNQEANLVERKHQLEIEEEKNKIRSNMQKALIDSDLERVEATAKLEAYEKMDTKEEREHIREMLGKAIDGLSERPIVTNAGGASE